MRRRILLLVLSVLILSACTIAWGQTTSATLTGHVVDNSGAVVTGAQVVAISTETNVRYPGTTNGEGIYLLVNLKPGNYHIEVSKQGFSTSIKPDVVLHVQDVVAINFTLSPGSVAQTITVESGAPLLNTESSTMGTVIDSAKVLELPLNGRNFVQLAQLTPGVQAGTPGSITVRRGRGSLGQNDPGGAIGMSANGSRDTANRFYIDGVELMDYDAMTYPFSPSIDSLAEFKVETSTYSAESGGAPGGQVSIVTKSGGEHFHGTLWEFNRNDAFSQTYDALAHVDSKPPRLNRNQFGINVGGPVYLPKLYDGRGKTFFFFNWESGRLVQGSVPETKLVPTVAQRAGDFTGFTDSQGNPVVLKDKLNGCITANKITCPLSPQALAFLAFEPLPNASVVTNGVLVSDYNTPRGKSSPYQNNYDARIDRAFSPKDIVYGRYLFNDTFEASLPVWGHDTRNNLGRDQNVAFSYVHTFAPALINEARFGWNRFAEHEIFATTNDPNFDVANKMGLAGVSALPANFGPPDITISGGGSAGTWDTYNLQRQIGPRDRSNTIYQFGDTFSWQRGAHLLKFGAEIDRRNVTFEQARTPRGQFRFDGSYTGSALADFMLGYVRQAILNPVHTSTDLSDYWQAYFVNDQWKVLPQLTVNLGLRYDYFQPYTEAHDRYVNVQQTGLSLSPTAVAFTPHGTANSLPSPFGRALIAPDRKNFGPRIGVAWQPGGFLGKDFVIRAGYGIYYTPDISNIFFSMVEGFQATGVNITGSPTPTGKVLFSDRFDQVASTLGPFPFAPSVDPHLKSSYVQQWNLDLQHKIPGNILVDVGYVGSKGTRLDVTLPDINRPIQLVNPKSVPPPAPVNTRRPNQSFLRPVQGEMSIGNSIYHALQVKLERRTSHGLLFLTAYTYSKTISGPSDIGGAVGGGFFIGAPQDNFNLRADRSVSGFDQTHRFVETVIYDLPFFRHTSGITGSLLGGWQLGTIVSLQSGFPTMIDFGQDTTGTGLSSRADLLPGQNGNLSSGRTFQHWFNTSAFAAPANGRFGTSPRTDAIRMPGSENVDFSVNKQFRFQESRRFEVRGDIFNLFNHFNPTFISASANQSVVGASPNLKVGTPNFGKIGNGVNGIFQTRVIQVGAKLYF
ncbi:MAG TPA: TonB-dependent receptor [Terriglobales bacterium]|jgi:hypothetical protein|nr:TonB-dependent receptor [Terriglobales bacterium]